jgi:hypothetical protein
MGILTHFNTKFKLDIGLKGQEPMRYGYRNAFHRRDLSWKMVFWKIQEFFTCTKVAPYPYYMRGVVFNCLCT